LITVVLAIRVTEARGAVLEFVPGLAFAVIMVTNALLVLASFRARRASPVVAGALDASAIGASSEVSVKRPHRSRWLVNAVLLFLLAAGGFMLWYGNQPGHFRSGGVVEWVRVLLHRRQ
jgi:hypothetical protein